MNAIEHLDLFVRERERERDAACPSDMRDIIDSSSSCTSSISCNEVKWMGSKDYLLQSFTHHSSLMITQYHLFKFT